MDEETEDRTEYTPNAPLLRAEVEGMIDEAVAQAQANNEEPLELWLRDDAREALGLNQPFEDADGTEYHGSAVETTAGILQVLDPPETDEDPGDAMPPCAHDKALRGDLIVVVTRQDYHRDGLKAPDEYTEEDFAGPLDTQPGSFLDPAYGHNRAPANPYFPAMPTETVERPYETPSRYPDHRLDPLDPSLTGLKELPLDKLRRDAGAPQTADDLAREHRRRLGLE